ncbi:MAG: methylated-DNA--[protein]-cysteine S-methyltransferase [Candidatus Peregrinibacteria bacterium]|nr:methylated-DNA--[protein]-cysteine S-methyltransferase [Candidatus Peregrinibacteria bacterium]MCB9807656.1 methylated-DNA--[protein]-cysteine S-methyltransferase [Candidatus Peribacteria bacterium]
MPITLLKSHIETPIGYLEVSGTEQGITSITFLDEKPDTVQSDNVHRDVVSQLNEYFDGKRTAFHSLQLSYPATEFQIQVWDTLMNVPFGETISYGELAKRSGHNGAARAVGTAMNVNPLPLIIPCHRVLPADRSLGDYAFGAERKRWLLEHEASHRSTSSGSKKVM